MNALTEKQLDALRFYAGLPQRRYLRGRRWPHSFTVESLRKRGLLGFNPCSIVRADGCITLYEPNDGPYVQAPLVRTGFRLHGHEWGTGNFGTALTLAGLHTLALLAYRAEPPVEIAEGKS